MSKDIGKEKEELKRKLEPARKLSFKEHNFDVEVGQKAAVDRHILNNEDVAKYNGDLKKIGEGLNYDPDNLEHIGSMAVHVYKSELLGTVFYMDQLLVDNIPEVVAHKAFENLKGTAMEAYGRKRTVRRSGF